MRSSLLASLLLVLCASVASAVDVTLSGKVLDLQGNPKYAFLDFYRSSDKVIVAGVYSGLFPATLGNYSVTLPPGTYDVYVRSFGDAPSEVRNVSVQGNVVQNFTIDTQASRTVPATLKSAATSTPAVFAGVGTSVTTLFITATQDLGPTLLLFNEFGSFTVDGVPLGVFALYDDGTHGDATAGDHVYSRSGIGFHAATNSRCSSMGLAKVLYARTTAGDIVQLPGGTVIGVKPALAAPPAMLTANGSQFTPDAANVIVDATKSGWEKLAVQRFYQSFADAYDFIFFFPDVLQTGAAGRTVRVRNTITGLGAPIIDDSGQYGSPHTLQAFALIDYSDSPPLLHEILHRWQNDLQPPFDPAYAGHWGYSSVNGQLGGFDGATLVTNADGSYTVASVGPFGVASDQGLYAPLERYLAGFLPASAVPPTTIFTNVQTIGGDLNHFTGVRTDVTIASLIAKYGPRNPSVESSQKRFRIAFVGVSRQPLTAAGMTYLTILAQEFAGRTGCTRLSFPVATGGVAVVDTAIVLKPGVRRRAVR